MRSAANTCCGADGNPLQPVDCHGLRIGLLPVDTDPDWIQRFTDLYDRIGREVAP
jgi:hypothetical protein